MNEAATLTPDLDLDLPDGRGVNFPPPILPHAAYCEWLEEMFQEMVRHGALDRFLADPTRRLPEVFFSIE